MFFPIKNLSSYQYILFFLVPRKHFFSAKLLQFNVNYSHARVFTLHQAVKKLNQTRAIK